MRKKQILVQKGEGFLGLLLGSVLQGLAELVLKKHRSFTTINALNTYFINLQLFHILLSS